MALIPVSLDEKSQELTKDRVIQIAQEEGADQNMMLALWQQESGSGANPKESIDGALGHFQVLPKIFESVMGGQGDINNPEDNARAAARLQALHQKSFPDRPDLQAAAYFSGEGNVRKAGGVPNTKDGNGKTTPSYVNDVIKRYASLTPQPKPSKPKQDDVKTAYANAERASSLVPIDLDAPTPQEKPAEDDGDFVRSVKNYWPQLKEMFGAIQTIGGAAAKKVGLDDFGDSLIIGGLERINTAQSQQKSKSTDSFTDAYDQGGIPALVTDWLPYQAGQAVGNLGEAVLSAVAGAAIGGAVGGPAAPVTGTTGAVGGILFKTLAKKGIINEAKKIAAELGGDAAKAYLKKESGKLIGLNAGIALSAAYHGSGEVGSRMVDELQRKGVPIQDIDLGRFAQSATGHAFLEFVGDKIGLGAITKPLDKSFGGGLAGAAKNISARGVSTGLKEAPVEVGQTGFERYGAELPLTGQDARKEYIDSGAAGFGMGLVTGAGGGVVQSAHSSGKEPEQQETPQDVVRRYLNVPQQAQPSQQASQPQQPATGTVPGLQRQNPEDQLAEQLSGRQLSDIELRDIAESNPRNTLQYQPNATLIAPARTNQVKVNGKLIPVQVPASQQRVTIQSYAGLGPDGRGYVEILDANRQPQFVPLSSITNADRETVARLRSEISAYKQKSQQQAATGTAAPQTATNQEIQRENADEGQNAQETGQGRQEEALLNAQAEAEALSNIASAAPEQQEAAIQNGLAKRTEAGKVFLLPAGRRRLTAVRGFIDKEYGGLVNKVETAASEAATSPQNDLEEPSQAQKQAGNYKKGHVNLHGLDISIENPAGSTRSGVSADGKKWKTELAHHYGYIKRTEGADGDHVDVFIGDNPASQRVFVVDQVDPKTGEYDEHKVMLGFDNEASALEGYHANYSKGWNGAAGITEMSMDEFKDWLANGDTTKAVSTEHKAKIKKPQTPSDNLLGRIRQLGGINTRYRADILRDKQGAPGLFRENGLGLDELATQLHAEGFDINTEDVDGGVSDLSNLIEQAISGIQVFNHAGQERQAQEHRKQEHRDTLKSEIERLGGKPGKTASIAQLEKLVDKLRSELTEAQRNDAMRLEAILGKELSQDEWDAMLSVSDEQLGDFAYDMDTAAMLEAQLNQENEQNATERRYQEEGAGNSGAAQQSRADQNAETGGSAAQTEKSEESPNFKLTGQSNQEIATDEARRKKEAEAKARQEEAPSPEEFSLTGSDRAADVGAAHGQQDIFSQPESKPNQENAVDEEDENAPLWAGKYDVVKKGGAPNSFYFIGKNPDGDSVYQAGNNRAVVHGDYVVTELSHKPKSERVAEFKTVEEIIGVNPVDNTPSVKPESVDNQAAEALGKVDAHLDLLQRVKDGDVTADEFKAAFESVLNGKEEITAELEKMSKKAIFEKLPGLEWRYKNDKKSSVVRAAYLDMVTDFNLNNTLQWGASSGMTMEQAVQANVNKTNDESLAEYAAKVKKRAEERAAERATVLAGIENPESFEDFGRLMRVKMSENEGMTFQQARMTLTPEQRAKYDELSAEKSRGERANRKEAQRDQFIRAPGEKVATTEIIKTKHTKHGHDLWQFNFEERVSPAEFKILAAQARALDGNYSSYRGNGAIPGWQFRSEESAKAFKSMVAGDATEAKEIAKARRDAFADDRSQTAVERLTEMADALEERANSSLSRNRKANTERRARFAASAEASANSDKALAKTMRNIAQTIDAGKAKFLDRVRQKVQVEMLNGFVRSAQNDMLRAQYPSYSEQEKHFGEAPTVITADYAEFPSYTAYRSDLATLGRALLVTEGTKLLGQKIMKVADDVSAAYLKFSKENIEKVDVFRTKDGSRASFPSKGIAERSIEHSGFKGRAIVLQFKRNENLIILSPSEAMKRGVWKGDGDKRITFNSEFGAELVEKIGKANRRARRLQDVVSAPYHFDNAYEKLKRLAAMGIETPAELRTALREFIGLREEAEQPSKVKQLERSMIGRKNDGLDFFPTSPAVADDAIEALGIESGMSVYEPQAGMGHIADRLREQGFEPDVGELSGDRRELLEAKGYNVVSHDFMEMKLEDTPNGEGYDRIIMNPPFSDRRDALHVQHAYSLLKPGGRLVSIMGEGVFFGQDKKATAFRDWLDERGATDEKLPEGSFLDTSLPVNTSVNARMVVIDKSADARFSRNKSTQGISSRDAEAIVRAFESVNKNAPKIYIHDDVNKAPENLLREIQESGADGDIEGAFFNGEIHLFPGHINSLERLTHVLTHEGRHFAFHAMHGKAMDSVLLDIYQSNDKVREKADQKRAALGIKSVSEATEEVLADTPVEDLVKLKGWGRIKVFIRLRMRQFAAALRRSGFDEIGKWLQEKIGGWTDADIAGMVRNADKFVRSGSPGHSYGVTRFSGNNDIWNLVATAWKKLGTDDAIFQNRTPDSFDMEGAAREIDPGMRAYEDIPEADDPTIVKKWMVQMPDKSNAYIYENEDGKVWIDASRLSEGSSGGTKLYLLAGSYAEGNGKVFVGDPQGLSDIALLRRTENMISLALRFGRTDFMEPHKNQVNPADKFETKIGQSLVGIEWEKGDDDGNLAQMIYASYANNLKLAPELRNVVYNFEQDKFEYADGQEFTNDDFGRVSDAIASAYRAGGLRAVLDQARELASVLDEGRLEPLRSALESNIKRNEAKSSQDDAQAGNRDNPDSNRRVAGQTSQVQSGRIIGSATLKRTAITNGLASGARSSRRADVLAGISAVVQRGLTGTKAARALYSRNISYMDSLKSEAQNPPRQAKFSRAAVLDTAHDWAASLVQNDKSLSPWMRTIGTQYHKAVTLQAKGMPHFKRVFDKGMDFLGDISTFAIRAEQKAPDMFKRVNGLGDFFRGGVNSKDVKAISSPLFDGTLTVKRVFTDEHLTKLYKLTPNQIKMYRQALAAVNQSLEDVAKSLIAKHAQVNAIDYDRDQSLHEMATSVAGQLRAMAEEVGEAQAAHFMDVAGKIDQIAAKPRQLADEAYFPLMRFGDHTVTETDDTGNVTFFGLYESQFQANQVANALREDGAGTVSTGVLSKNAYKLYGGLNLEALQLFADQMDVSDSPVYQEYLKNAVNNRSVLKRLIHRKGTPGFSRDVERTLAQFITSNARHASTQYNLFDMRKAAEDIPARYGDVKDEAINLWEYVSQPAEEAHRLRGLLFFQYLGGSVASAMVNLTQVPMMSAPYLAQYQNPLKLAGTLGKAATDALLDPKNVGGDIGNALRRAEEEGITAPQEIHQLTATASNSLFSSNHKWNSVLKAWGGMFAAAESFNRRTTFMAAFNIGKERGMDNHAAYEFASNAVHETQGIYSKVNRPNWARGAVGSTVFTFKQYSVAYLELLKRLPPKQQAIMLGILILASGLEGLPFEEDALDLVDTVGQWLGFATNSKQWVHKAAHEALGKEGAKLALNGISAVLPIDLQGRMGMHNLIPGSAVLKQSETSKGRDVVEFVGPAGSLLKSAADALENLAQGRFTDAGIDIAPRAVQNAVSGGVMLSTGEARDRQGRKVTDVSPGEGFAKVLGFNPNKIAELSETKRGLIQDRNLLRVKEDGIVSDWVNGIVKNKPEEVAKARRELAQWNKDNPDMQISISAAQIRNRVRAARIQSDVRFLRSLPKEQRARARAALAEAADEE